MHVIDAGLSESSDHEIWRYASENGFVLISKGQDFADTVLRETSAKLIWVRVGNCRRAFLLDVFRRMCPRLLERLESGDVYIEIR